MIKIQNLKHCFEHLTLEFRICLGFRIRDLGFISIMIYETLSPDIQDDLYKSDTPEDLCYPFPNIFDMVV